MTNSPCSSPYRGRALRPGQHAAAAVRDALLLQLLLQHRHLPGVGRQLPGPLHLHVLPAVHLPQLLAAALARPGHQRRHEDESAGGTLFGVLQHLPGKQRFRLEHGGGWTDAATVCSKQRVYLEEGGDLTDAATVCSKQRVYLEEGGGLTDAATVCSKQRVYLEEGGVFFIAAAVFKTVTSLRAGRGVFIPQLFWEQRLHSEQGGVFIHSCFENSDFTAVAGWSLD